jgi:hypothetical protein
MLVCRQCGHRSMFGPRCAACDAELDAPPAVPASPPAGPPPALLPQPGPTVPAPPTPIPPAADAPAPTPMPPPAAVGTPWQQPNPLPPPALAAAPWQQPHPTPPPLGLLRDGACDQCGARPATEATFRNVTGFILAFRVGTTKSEWCRDCGLAAGRALQNRTLLGGWWGFVSAACNVGVTLANGATLRKVGRLAPPEGGDPLRRGVPGRSSLLRAGMVVPAVLVALVAAVIVFGTDRGAGGFAVGDCVRAVADDTDFDAVDCAQVNDGRVVGLARQPDDCPAGTDSVLEDSQRKERLLVCLDEG